MKSISELTKEQAIEIAKLAFGHPEWIVSDFHFKYQPYIEEWYEDAREYVSIRFEAYFAGDKTTYYKVEITPELNVALWYLKRQTGMRDIYSVLHILNQRKIQETFTEYGF